MAQIFSTLALMLATSVALGPGDPVGIHDGGEDIDPNTREVSIDRARWESLRAIAEAEAPVVLPPGPWAAQRVVTIQRSSEGVRVRVTWSLEAIEAGWWTGALIGPRAGMRVESVSWRGRELGVTSTTAGQEVAIEMPAKSRGELKLVVFVPVEHLLGGVDGDFDMQLMPAVRGELRVDGPAPEGRVPELVADGQARRLIDGRFWTGEAQLRLGWVDASTAGDDAAGPLAVAQAAVGLTFGDAEVRGRARVSWLLRQGQLDRVSIETSGLGRDLEVAGANVHEWTRSGDRIDIELKEPASGRVEVDLRWTQGLASGAEAKLAAPRITPQQAYRTESYMQIARDGELEVVPKLAGWSAVASAELPEWAGGYIQGTATATYQHDSEAGGASFELLRFVPLSGPPVMVDVAAYEIATTDEGRSLVHARYDVRNERSPHLRMTLPAGSRMLGVRVNGETVTPTRDAGTAADSAGVQAWRIPLVRSLESVKGSLSFPVEVIFISESDDWKKKEARELQLPALDAPVAISRVRVYLPPNYDNRVALGDFHRVSDFSEGEGITYGLGVGANAEEVNRADELYREAQSRWMANDFDRAQESLDELSSLGASNANIEGLQANLDLVSGRGELEEDEDAAGGQAAVVSRRIKDQAKMRATEDKLELLEKTREAEQLEAQGQYDRAEQKLAEAQELGDRLAMLEQTESKEQAAYNQSLSSKSAQVADKKKRKAGREREATKRKQVSVYSFENDDITGDVLLPSSDMPMGNATAGPTAGPVSGLVTGESEGGDRSYHNRRLDYDLDGQLDGKDGVILDNEVGGELGTEFRGGADVPDPEPEPIPEEEIAPPIILDGANITPTDVDSSRDYSSIVFLPGSSGRPKPRKGRGPTGGKQAKNDERGPAKPKPPAPEKPMEEPMQAAPPADPNAALAGPVATASAVTVHVPAVGEAVLYQHMLLPEGQALTVRLEARRHKASKRRSR